MIITEMLRKALGIGARIWHAMAPILTSESGRLLEQVLPVATAVVYEVAKTHDLPNAKRDAAFKEISKRLVGSGISVSASLLNLAIELAVVRAKAVGGDKPL